MKIWIERGLIILLIAGVVAFGVRERDREQISQSTGGQPAPEMLMPGHNPDVPNDSAKSGKTNSVPIDFGGLSVLCGAQIEECSLNGWVKIDKPDATDSDLMFMVEQAVRPLESVLLKDGESVWPAGSWTFGSIEGARGVNYLRWLGNDRYIEAWARSTDYSGGELDNLGMTYLVARLIGFNEQQMAASLHTTMAKSLERLGEEKCITMEAICWREGELDAAEMSSRVSLVLASAEAQEVERTNREGQFSVTAYSPIIPEYSENNGARVNIQVAARYHVMDNRTYFHLGIPQIMEAY